MGLETAAIAGIASLASTGVSAGMSFAQANKANRARLQAERDARESMDEVMKRLEVNPYEDQPIFKEPFERQRENALALGAQAIDAASEGERGAAEAANRVLYGMNDIQGQITDKQTEYLNKINENILKREAELNDWGVGIGLKSAEGAQRAAANFDALANKATGEAYQGVASGIGQAINLIPLFPKKKETTTAPPIIPTQTTASSNQSVIQQNPLFMPNVPPGNNTLAGLNAAYMMGQYNDTFNPFNPLGFRKR